MSFFDKHGLKIIAVTLAAVLIFANLSWGRAFFKTLILLPEFIPNSQVKTINLFTKRPQIKEVQFQGKNEPIYADLWLPDNKKKHPAAVLHLGVDIDRKDPRVQSLANSLARSGVATLVPNIPSLERRRILAEGKEDLTVSFEFLKNQPNIKKEKVGLIAFCASGGVVLLAAEEQKIAGDVDFIVVINPYYDLSTLYENVSLHQIKDNDQVILWQPHFKTVEIYNRETISLLENDSDREILKKYLVKISQERLEKGQYETLSPEDQNKLTKDGQFTYELLTSKDPNRISFYQENATENQKNFVRDLSPSTNIGSLKAKTFILMDKNNVFIPYTQAQMLDEALGKKATFAQTKLLPAGDLVENLPIGDYFSEGFKISRFIFLVLKEIS